MKKLLEHVMKNQLQNQIKQNLEQKKLREKEIKYMSNGKVMKIHLVVG